MAKLEIYKMTGEDSAQVQEFPFSNGTAYMYCSRKLESDPGSNQDSCAVVGNDGFCHALIVADGMGGHAGGQKASNMAIETVCQTLEKYISSKPEEFVKEIIPAIELAHQKIKELKMGAGTTFCMAFFQKDEVRFFNAGDSTAMIFGGKGKIKYRTMPHSPVGMALESGIIPESQAIGHENSNIVYNVLGHDFLRIETSQLMPLASKDTVIISSDGLTDNYTNTELTELLSPGNLLEDMEKLVTQLHDNVKNGDAHNDDTTIITFKNSD